MNTFLEILSPSYLLFPALLGTAILGLVCPLIGSYLILRRTVFLGLTLPQIAAAGVSFTFWLQQTGFLPQWQQGERGIGMIGSLLFTFLGMGLLGYLEQRRKGIAEGRLAAAYALAGALTILFIVFNPAGQIEVLNLLKGEVIALSKGELRLLAAVFGLVLVGMLLFRREFLLTSFDRDLAFLLKGRQIIWDVLLYLLAGVSIAFGVIMAGPLLLFGFLVLPALAARPLVNSMSSFLWLSSRSWPRHGVVRFLQLRAFGSSSGTHRRGSGMLPDFPRLRAAPSFAQAGAGADRSEFNCAVDLWMRHDYACGAFARGQSAEQ